VSSTSNDRYQQLTGTPPGRFIQQRLGLPDAPRLRRFEPGAPLLDGAAVVLGQGRLAEPAAAIVADAGVEVLRELPDGDRDIGAVIFDATAITTVAGLEALYEALHPAIRRIAPSGRVVVLG